jgi:hypothetical protein
MSRDVTKPEIPIKYIDRLFRAQMEATSRGLFRDDANLELLLSIANITRYRTEPRYTIPLSFAGLFKTGESYKFIVDQMKKLEYIDPETGQWDDRFKNAVSIGFLKELQQKNYFRVKYKNIELAAIAHRFFGFPFNEDHFKGNKNPPTKTKSIPLCTL